MDVLKLQNKTVFSDNEDDGKNINSLQYRYNLRVTIAGSEVQTPGKLVHLVQGL